MSWRGASRPLLSQTQSSLQEIDACIDLAGISGSSGEVAHPVHCSDLGEGDAAVESQVEIETTANHELW
jgi:hypothetical protein